MKKSAVISLLLSLFVTTPIWYYLLYHVLLAINADKLMMFLFWVYVPFGMFIQTLAKFGEGK